MIINYTKNEFESAKNNTKLSLICEYCNNEFYVTKKTIIDAQRLSQKKQAKYCSCDCANLALKKTKTVVCINCNIKFEKQQHRVIKNNFCSHSCAATYNNTHKKYGTRKSKLESWLEIKLVELYPDLEIKFNKKDTINSELDIYIPSLKLAFELNGIYHYEPIYGKEKLQQIQNNDERKFQACLEQGIELCIIDTSQQKYFKEKTSRKYLNIIVRVLNSQLSLKDMR
jgi:hypothetical protein